MNQAIAATLATTPATAPQNSALLLLGIIILIGLFLIPGFVARSRKHINTVPIALTGLLFGWTIIGWGVALIWSFTSQAQVTGTSQAQVTGTASPAAVKPASPKTALDIRIMKYVGLTVAVLIVLLTLFSVFAKKTVDQGREPAMPPAKMGVLVPAEELFGE